MEPKSTEEIRKVAEEIKEWHARGKQTNWKIAFIEHLYQMPVECYHVHYEEHHSLIFSREKGMLRPELTWTYWAYDKFEQR